MGLDASTLDRAAAYIQFASEDPSYSSKLATGINAAQMLSLEAEFSRVLGRINSAREVFESGESLDEKEEATRRYLFNRDMSLLKTLSVALGNRLEVNVKQTEITARMALAHMARQQKGGRSRAMARFGPVDPPEEEEKATSPHDPPH